VGLAAGTVTQGSRGGRSPVSERAGAPPALAIARPVRGDPGEIETGIEYIGKKCDAGDSQQAETRRHFDVVAEGLRSQIQLDAEGVSAVDQRRDRFEQQVAEELAETRAAAVNERVERLESGRA